MASGGELIEQGAEEEDISKLNKVRRVKWGGKKCRALGEDPGERGDFPPESTSKMS